MCNLVADPPTEWGRSTPQAEQCAGTHTGTATGPCGTSGVESRHAYKDCRVKRRTAHPADALGKRVTPQGGGRGPQRGSQ
jgi:hypothetical protein